MSPDRTEVRAQQQWKYWKFTAAMMWGGISPWLPRIPRKSSLVGSTVGIGAAACISQPSQVQEVPTPTILIVTATPTETLPTVVPTLEPTATSTATPTATPEQTPVNLAECQPQDIKEEGEIFVKEKEGVLRRKLPVKTSDYDGAAAQNTRLTTECLRENWYRVKDSKGNFWTLMEYVSKEPVALPTAIAAQRVEPRQAPPEPKVEQKIVLNTGLNRPLAQGFTDRVNIRRRSIGVTELKVDSRLQSAAEKYAQLIYTNTSTAGTCSGQAVEVDCHMVNGAPWDRAKREGYPSTSVVGEVFMGLTSGKIRIIQRNPSEEQIIRTLLDPMTYTDFGLFNSPPHREALLSGNNKVIGVGCHVGPDHYAGRQSGETEYSGICIGNLGS